MNYKNYFITLQHFQYFSFKWQLQATNKELVNGRIFLKYILRELWPSEWKLRIAPVILWKMCLPFVLNPVLPNTLDSAQCNSIACQCAMSAVSQISRKIWWVGIVWFTSPDSLRHVSVCVYKILCVCIQIYAHISAKPDVSHPTFPGGLHSRSGEVSFLLWK